MIGICSFGVYLPAYRLSRDVIAQAVGSRAGGGGRTVANYDEDALTMGIDAAFECLDNYERCFESPLKSERINALFFATASSPFREKQASSIMSTVLGMKKQALAVDVLGSLRSGLMAMDLSLPLLKEGNGEGKGLIVVSDKRPAAPASGEEQAFGDGAAALLLGRENILVSVEAHCRVNANFPHYWRRENDPYVQVADARFAEDYGYLSLVVEAIKGLMKKTQLTPKDIAKLIVYTPNSRLAKRLARKAGFNADEQLAEAMLNNLGDTGSAQVFITLFHTLMKAKAAERLILAGYGDGADAFLLQVTENIEKVHKCRGVDDYLRRQRPLGSYGKYLHFKEITEECTYDAFSSLALLWREEKQNLGLYGVRCENCGTVAFPRRRVCHHCGAKDRMADFKLSRRGIVYTYTNDYLYLNPDPPESLAAVDLEGGGRIFCQVTDVSPQDMKIGLPVELTFRKLHDGQNIPNYFWKARPAIGR